MRDRRTSSQDDRMARRRHHERHFAGSDAVRDVILGMSDGLMTPFALEAMRTRPAFQRVGCESARVMSRSTARV
jgi:hypothetical protein